MIQNVNNCKVNALGSPQKGRARNISAGELAFSQILSGQSRQAESQQPKEPENSLRFSKHAAIRAAERGMDMTPELTGRLMQAVDTARGKGAREVAVIGPQGVFIINIKNSVVVTSISNQELKDNIITNIDSAVIL